MEDLEAIEGVFKALGDSNRLKIIDVLTLQCTSVNEIAKKAGISQPLTSHHLEALSKAGIARMQNFGKFHYY